MKQNIRRDIKRKKKLGRARRCRITELQREKKEEEQKQATSTCPQAANTNWDNWAHFTRAKPQCCSSCCFPSPFVCAHTCGEDESGRGRRRKWRCETHTGRREVITSLAAGEGAAVSPNVFTKGQVCRHTLRPADSMWRPLTRAVTGFVAFSLGASPVYSGIALHCISLSLLFDVQVLSGLISSHYLLSEV